MAIETVMAKIITIPSQDEHIKLFQKTLLALNKMKRGKQKMMIEIQNN